MTIMLMLLLGMFFMFLFGLAVADAHYNAKEKRRRDTRVFSRVWFMVGEARPTEGETTFKGVAI